MYRSAKQTGTMEDQKIHWTLRFSFVICEGKPQSFYIRQQSANDRERVITKDQKV